MANCKCDITTALGKITKWEDVCSMECRKIQGQSLIDFMNGTEFGWTFIICAICEELKKYSEKQPHEVDNEHALNCSDCCVKLVRKCPCCGFFDKNNKNMPTIKCKSCKRFWCWICNKICKNGKESVSHPFQHKISPNSDNLTVYNEYFNNTVQYKYLTQVPEKYRTKELIDMFILRKPVNKLFVIEQTPEVCKKYLMQYFDALKLIKNQDDEMIRLAISLDPYSIEYVANQKEEYCLEAVTKGMYAIRYIRNPSPQVSMIAVQKWGGNIQYIKEQNPELCRIALKMDRAYGRYFTPEMKLVFKIK